jgi:hypothetical protein
MNWLMQFEGDRLTKTAVIRTRIYPQTRRIATGLASLATRRGGAWQLTCRAWQLRSDGCDAIGVAAPQGARRRFASIVGRVRPSRHAGSEILRGVSSHLLVATHAFLETVHYSVWLLALPLVGMRRGGDAPWQVESLPLVRHPRRGWPRVIRAALVVSAACVVLLWLAFLADYPTTRDLYFTLAMAHVLAEAPFLLRML